MNDWIKQCHTCDPHCFQLVHHLPSCTAQQNRAVDYIVHAPQPQLEEILWCIPAYCKMCV